MNDSSELLKIAEVAAITKLSANAIRFYEKKKIVESKRAGNNYRYFTYDDVRKLNNCKVYKNLGFSLEEIELLVNHASAEEAKRMFASKEKTLEAEIAERRKELELLKEIQNVEGKYQHYRQGYFVRDIEELYFFCYVKDGIHNRKVIYSSEYDKLSRYRSITKGTMLVSPDKLNKNDQLHPTSGFSISKRAAQQLGFSEPAHAVVIPRQRCVCTVITSTSMLSYKDLQEALDWMEYHRFSLNGDIIVKVLSFTFDRGHETRTYEICLPC